MPARRILSALVVLGTLFAAAPAHALKISEYRLRGPNGAEDEFVELYNEASTPVTVAAADDSAGWTLLPSDNTPRVTIPNGTVIPAHGHYLVVNSDAYSLTAYPSGSGATAAGDATYTIDIPDNIGLALFRTANPVNFNLENRLDAVGPFSAPVLYREGSGLPSISVFPIDYSFVRDARTPTGLPQDSDDNAADFVFVDTDGTDAGAGQRIGAPGPENLASPVSLGGLSIDLLDPTVAADAPPNLVRDTTPAPPNGTFGTLDIRRTITNTGDTPLTRLRFRIADITTFLASAGVADLRARTSGGVTVGDLTVRGTTLEVPPAQDNGGGFNSSMSVPTVEPGAPLAPGESIRVRFVMGIQQDGEYRFCANAEGTTAGGAVAQSGSTSAAPPGAPCVRAETLRPTNTTPPTVLGVAREAATLTVNDGAWRGSPAPAGFTHQWQRCDASGDACTDIADATEATYVPVETDVGATLRVAVRTSTSSGSGTAASAPVGPVAAGFAPRNVTPPGVSGRPRVGAQLTADDGAWTRPPFLIAHQWQRCNASGDECLTLPGATASTYVARRADAGSTLRAAVTATNVVGPDTATSAATGRIAACRVPRLRGKKLAAAKRALRKRRCRPGRVRRRPSSSVEPGRVLAHKPKAGSVRPVGTRVRLVVSTRP
jgi:hypothetical protein